MKAKRHGSKGQVSRGSHFLFSAMFALLAIGIFGCGDDTTSDQAPLARPVKMITLGESGATSGLEYPGTVGATLESEMTFEVPGKINELPVVEGQQVAKGDLLASLDVQDLKAARDADLASQRAAKSEYERFRDLYANNAASLAELEAKQNQFEVADARLVLSEKALRDCKLIAPFSGQVARTYVENFENIGPGQKVLLLQDLSAIEIIVNIPESDAARARRLGEISDINAHVSLASIPDRKLPATLSEFATTADPVTRTFRATFAFDNPGDINVLPGMTGRLTIDVSTADLEGHGDAFTVPAAAVVAAEDGQASVWVVDLESMTVTRRPVETGELSGDNIMILSGLSPGETIAVSGTKHMSDGMEVRRFGD